MIRKIKVWIRNFFAAECSPTITFISNIDIAEETKKLKEGIEKSCR